MTPTDLAPLDAAQKRALLAEKLRQGGDGPRRAPLSLAQQRLWFIDQMQPGQPVYTISAALRLNGPLDVGHLSAALDRIRARHESLRTRFADEGGAPVQIVDPPSALHLAWHDASPDGLEPALAEFARAPFDLARGPLVRCALYRLAPDAHVLAFAAHHIVADYRSLQVMIAELTQLYQGRDLPPLPLQYADHALAQRRRAAGLGAQFDYWRRTLDGLPPLLDLPTDAPRPARQDFAGARHRFALPEAVSRRIEALARQLGVTPFTLLLAGFHILHQRYSGSRDICIGTTVSNRDRAELQGLVGYFVNTLALRCTIAEEDSLSSLLERMRGTVLGAMRHQEVPFEQVVEAAAPDRSLAHPPLFQTMFNLHEKQPDRVVAGELEIVPQAVPGRSARFDLCLDLFHGAQITGVLEYATALFRPRTARRMAQDYVRILDAATADPARRLSEICLLDAADRCAIAAINDTARPLPGKDLASLVAARAATRRDATALLAGKTRLSHAELDAAAMRLASRIAPQVAQGTRIAVCLPRTADMVVALLAALKLGAAYVPLDPTHPPKRLRHILQDAAPALLISTGPPPVVPPCPVLDLDATRAEIEATPARRPDRQVDAGDIAYVIFTSGTTGRPKGVPIRQQSLVNLLASMAETPGMTEADTLVAVTTPAFDIAALELFLPLVTGGTLVLADSHDVVDGLALSRLIDHTGATMMQATPATWRLLAEEGWQAPDGFRMLCGGEALDPALAARLLEGGGRLWNLYGPTETTIWSACAQITADDCARGLIPLGAPVANTALHVLDPAGQPCPPGVAGELHIGGAGLSPGYLDRPDLTAERFVEVDGLRLYRTGDRVRRLADGTLVYLGRLDFQLKLRGFRIEPGEIEALLAADPAVEQTVVALHGEGEEASLVAWLRAAPAPDLEPRLRARLAQHLPGYMMPAAFVTLDALPLNANGKVDRLRLPPPTAAPAAETQPQTGTETLLSRLWAHLLDTAPPGREADFFALGGHSLLAMRMVARLPHDGPRAVPLRLLFEHPRLAAFAAALDAAGILRDTPPPPIPRLPEGTEPPLSDAQERQWTLAQLDPGQAAYNIPAALRLTGPLDVPRLGRAFALLCGRHDVLRSAYPEAGGRPCVVLRPGPGPDLAANPLQPTAVEKALRAEAARPFDLASGPLVRLCLYRTGPDDHALLLVLHHIIGDALSLQLLLRELMAHYDALGRDPGHLPPPLPVQYADYAAWQRSQDLRAATDYWIDTLDGAPPLIEVPTDFPRPARQDFAGGSVDFTLSGDAARGIRALAAQCGATPYMALLAVYAVFLGRYAEAREVVVGTPVSARPHPDLEDLAGMFVNTLALRLPADGARPFRDLLATCRERVLAGFAHQDAPFERIVEALEPDRTWSHNPIFQAMFVWRTQQPRPATLPGGLAWKPLHPASTTAKVDLHLGVLDCGDEFALRLEYRRDLFRPETAQQMARSFEALAASIAAAPDTPSADLSLLHPDQARQIAAWNDTGTIPANGPATLHDLVSARAALVPDRVAIRDSRHAVTYAALEARSDALTAHLQDLGFGRGDRIGVALPRRIDLVAAILAVLKTGAAYVPLDPRYPAERIALIAEDAALSLILADAPGDGALDLCGFWDGPPGIADTSGGAAARPAPVPVAPDDLAYLIYTSGSTGRPKGVALEHRNATALVRWAEGAFTEAQLAGVLGATSVCFDLSVFEIFATLGLGGTLLLVDDLFALPAAPFADQVTLINTVPTAMAELLRLGPLPPCVSTVCLAGEATPPALAARLAEAVPTFWHLYGPSEDTTFSSGMTVTPAAPYDLGHPFPGTRFHVLDEALQEVPPGLPGELFISGAGVGRGYWNRPGLTAERFLPNPFDRDGSAPVMYRTGDRVRRTASGTLAFLGRGDRQVKVRGFRVEPGEVETALADLPGVAAAMVDLWRDGDAPARLVAWVEGTATPADLTEQLARRLPAHLVPTLLVVTDALPRLPNGKLDRKSLPALDGRPDIDPRPADPPRSGLEAQLAAIWRRVLGRDGIARDDGFFAIGGDSILAIQVVAQAREAGIVLSPRDLFQHPTIAALAAAAQGRGAPVEAQGPVTGPQALTPIQRWFLDRDLPQAQHWNQAVVLAPVRPLDPDHLDRAFALLAEWHDVLRARFVRTGARWEQHYAPAGAIPPLHRAQGEVTAAAARMQAAFDLESGPLWGAVLCDTEDGQRLAVAAHHLLVDGVSWRILLGDLQRIYTALESGEDPAPPRRGTSPGAWAERLADHPGIAAERAYWQDVLSQPAPPLPFDHPDAPTTEGTACRHQTRIDPDLTHRLLQEVPAAYPVTTQEVLVAALALALRERTGAESLALEMESHGRPDLSEAVDLSRTIGWLTGLYPVRVATAPDAAPPEILRAVKDTLRRVPNDGIGYGVLRHLTGVLPAAPPAQVRFNYLGQAGALFGEGALFRPALESAGPTSAPENPRDLPLEINAAAHPDGLRVTWTHTAGLAPQTVAALGDGFARHLGTLVAHCLGGDDAGLTPADFPDMDFAQDDLDDLLKSL